MMNSLTIEQIARVFAMYIGNEVTTPPMDDEILQGYLTGIHGEYEAEVQHIENGNAWEGPEYYAYKDTKLLLRAISSITNKDAIEVAQVHFSLADIEDDKTIAYLNWIKQKIHAFTYCPLSHQYLIQQGYAAPLFIAPGHPDNGKDAISLGLAIDASNP